MRYLIVPLLASVALSGCSKGEDPILADYAEGVAALKAKDYDRAVKKYTEIIEQNTKYNGSAYASRGIAYNMKRDYAAARSDYEEAIRLVPHLASAHNNLAWLLATCPDPKYRDGVLAVEHARKACDLEDHPSHLAGLGAAFAETGQFDEAIKWQRAAMDHPKSTHRQDEKGVERIRMYEERKPCRIEDYEMFFGVGAD
jgi:Flp pilus assembly protein TadD